MVRWDVPWQLAADLSAVNWDSIDLAAEVETIGQVHVEIWGILLGSGTSIDQALGAANEPNAITHAFVQTFRSGLDQLVTLQEADGRVPLIIEYRDLEGSLVREFIYGHFTALDRCAYIYLIRISEPALLPVELEELERLITVEFDL